MTKPDWAERKVQKFVGGKTGLLWQEAAHLLRQERRRAVRVCRKVRGKDGPVSPWSDDMIRAYRDGCDDCARAIGGQ